MSKTLRLGHVKFYKYLLFILVVTTLISGCSGGSSSSSGSTANIDPSLDSTDSSLDNGLQDGFEDEDQVDVDQDDFDNVEPKLVPYEREEEYPRIVKFPLQFISSSNGKKIGVSVTLPADEKGDPIVAVFPTLLVQTAYNMSLTSIPSPLGALTGGPDPFFIKRGYAMVSVDALGSGVSEGGWELLGEEEQQGYGDVVDWILSQEWSNGKVGVSGVSYMGISALFTAQQRPEAIQAVFSVVPLGDAQRGTVGTGGLLNGVFMKTWMTLTQKLGTQNFPATLLNPQHSSQIMRSTQEHISHIDSFYLPLVDDALNGEDYIKYDGEFWRIRSPLEDIHTVTAPTFITGALHDIFQRGAPMLYEQLKENVDARLAIFDGDHISNMLQANGGNDDISPLPSLMLQWFDKHIKGLDSGTEDIPAVTQFVKNYKSETSDGFSTTTDWPHPLAEPERWFLHADMSLSMEPPVVEEGNHSMQASAFAEIKAEKSSGGQFLVFEVNPVDGSECSISYRQWTLGSSGLLFPPSCMYDSKEVEAGALNYESEPMEEPYYINGPIQADIWVDSTVSEAVVSVRVDEVSPDGEEILPLTNGLLAASARAVDVDRSRYIAGEMIQPYHYLTKEQASTVVPGQVFKMQIDIFPTSVIIRPGHRLRISISPSNQAQGIMNYEQRDNAEGGITTIHHSPTYPSSVVLPIVPTSALN